MFKFIGDRKQEVNLLHFAKLEAACNKHNVEEARKLEVEYKKDGSIHKGKADLKARTIRKWIKENKALKKFFLAHKKPRKYDEYRYKRNVTDRRNGLQDYSSSNTEKE
jgi:hypothetical protein